jgi:hypothetical protein
MNAFWGGNASALLATVPAMLGELAGAIHFVETIQLMGLGVEQ